MSQLHDHDFMAQFEQSKVEAKQQVNSMIDAIYAKVLEQWLNKDDRNDSVYGLRLNPNNATGRPIQLNDGSNNSYKSSEVNNELSATQSTTNPIQLNLPKTNRHLQCQLCPKSFVCRTKWRQHLRIHTGPFECDKCGKRFTNRYRFTRHQLIHRNVKPFLCEPCAKSFSDKSNLTKHQMIHQNIKAFSCHKCDKQFVRRDHFECHLRVHSGERPFGCRHCAKWFTSSDARNRHEQVKHLCRNKL